MREVTIKETIATIDKVLELAKSKCDETIPNRHLALYDLTRKMRACADALIPIEKYNILCVPTNLLYRCMIIDLLTSLLVTVVDDEQFKDVIYIMDYLYAKSIWNALNADTDVKKDLYPNEADDLEKLSLDYQEQHYDIFKDYLKSNKGEKWDFQKKPSLIVNGEVFNGSVDSLYKVLLKFPDVKHIASVYEYYKCFSQSEHFSMKNRVFIYKQDFHTRYYNKTRGFICLGEEYIYSQLQQNTNL